MNCLFGFVSLAILGCALGFTGQFIPNSFYTIDGNGRKSEVIYLTTKEDPVTRFRRSPYDSPKSASGSNAYSSSFATSGSGNFNPGDGGPIFFGDGEGNNPLQGIIDAVNSLQNQYAPNAGSSGFGGGGKSTYGTQGNANTGPVLFSRFGEGTGSGISASAKAQGQKGAFSSSSTSVDGDGKVKYSVQAGKY